MDIDSENFIVHIVIREQKEIVIDLVRNAQIKAQSRAQFRALIFNKAPTEVLAEYSNYNNIFLVENATKLSKYTKINNYAIKLKKEDNHLLDLSTA